MECEVCGVSVTDWNARFEEGVTHCKKCFRTDEAKDYINNKKLTTKNIQEKPELSSDTTESNSVVKESALIGNLCSIYALLIMLASFMVCAMSWPESPRYGSLSALVYLAPIAWLVSGFAQFLLFSALGQILSRLNRT